MANAAAVPLPDAALAAAILMAGGSGPANGSSAHFMSRRKDAVRLFNVVCHLAFAPDMVMGMVVGVGLTVLYGCGAGCTAYGDHCSG